MNSDNPPPWDTELADELLDSLVLIGVTSLDAGGNLIEQTQMFGRVTVVDPRRGISILLEGTRAGETYWLPPDLRCLDRARPGEYRLRSTGEVVRNPDFLCQWTVSQRADA
jgi:hypothetical protein